LDYSIEDVTPSNQRGAADALAAAFLTDPLFKYVIPDEIERRRWLALLKAELVRQNVASGHSRVAVDDEGRVAGTMCAGPYPPAFWDSLIMNVKLFLLPRPWEPNLRYMVKILTYLKIWERMHCKETHYYVYTIGVHPLDQHRGLGRRLMHSLIDTSEREGIPIYLETQTASNVPFYESLGFDVTEEHAPFEDGPHTWGMFRPLDLRQAAAV